MLPGGNTSKKYFQIITFSSILIITLVLFLGVGWQSWCAHKDIMRIQERDFRLQKLVGIIIHLDEVLTMSARMGAETGNLHWEKRYLRFEPQLDAAIKEAKEIVPETFLVGAAAHTNAANIKLVAMEKHAFELVRQGQNEDALAVLFSEGFEEQERIYAKGMKKIMTSIQMSVREHLKESQQQTLFTGVAIVITLPGLVFVWIYVLRLMKTYNIERRIAENKLKELNEELESRVSKRTANLKESNEQLRVEIIERMKAEKDLRESEARFRTVVDDILDNSIVGVFILDEKFKIVLANKALAQYFGLDRNEIIGKDERRTIREEIKGIFENPEGFAEKVLATYDNNTYVERFECHVMPEGEREERWLVHQSMPIRSGLYKGGRVEFYHDVTEHKKMEEALFQSEKLKSIGTITAGISHEFNNLLAIISGNVQLLEETYKDHEELMPVLRTIKEASDDGAEISSKMLGFTKTSQDTKKFVSFDISELIIQSLDFTKPRWSNEAQARGINYQIDKEGLKRISSIMCNPTEIREVFINIINNALDAMPEGGLLSFSTWSIGDTVFVGISDTGEGMSEDVKKSIFDPFFTTKSPVGTGLGMSMTYGIMTRHGGKIEVESGIGKGSIFTLQFPATVKAVSPIAIPEPEQETNGKNLRILVVDDEVAMCDILDKVFSGDGHKVKTADNGADAIELLKREEFDLTICDLAMPDVCGYDVIKALNGLEKRPKIGIITGWGENLRPIEENIKVDFIIKKPFNLSELRRQIIDLDI
jgi:PAS domain S-box-containing protein